MLPRCSRKKKNIFSDVFPSSPSHWLYNFHSECIWHAQYSPGPRTVNRPRKSKQTKEDPLRKRIIMMGRFAPLILCLLLGFSAVGAAEIKVCDASPSLQVWSPRAFHYESGSQLTKPSCQKKKRNRIPKQLPKSLFDAFWHFFLSRECCQVVGAGLGRTGTDSLRSALDILGYRTYHRMVIHDAQHHALWEKVYETRGTCAKSIDAALNAVVEGGYNTTTDFPVSACLRAWVPSHSCGQIKKLPRINTARTHAHTSSREGKKTRISALAWTMKPLLKHSFITQSHGSGHTNYTIHINTAQTHIHTYTYTQVSILFKEILARYPRVKVILSVRTSAKEWADKYYNTLGTAAAYLTRPPFRCVYIYACM